MNNLQNNEEIRQAIKAKRLKYYEVAHALGITPSWFTCQLRYELPSEKGEHILRAIEKL